MVEFGDIDDGLYVNQKQKADAALAKNILPKIKDKLYVLKNWDNQNLFDTLVEPSAELDCKKGAVLWIARVALTGLAVTPRRRERDCGNTWQGRNVAPNRLRYYATKRITDLRFIYIL